MKTCKLFACFSLPLSPLSPPLEMSNAWNSCLEFATLKRGAISPYLCLPLTLHVTRIRARLVVSALFYHVVRVSSPSPALPYPRSITGHASRICFKSFCHVVGPPVGCLCRKTVPNRLGVTVFNLAVTLLVPWRLVVFLFGFFPYMLPVPRIKYTAV